MSVTREDIYMGDAWGEAIIMGLCNCLNYLYYPKAKLVSLKLLLEERTPVDPAIPPWQRKMTQLRIPQVTSGQVNTPH